MNKKDMLASFASFLLFSAMVAAVFMETVEAQSIEGTLDLIDAVDGDNNVFWVRGSEPATYPNFALELKITDVTKIWAITFSIHWDPTILNLTWPGGVTVDTNCIFGTQEEPTPLGTGGTWFLCPEQIVHFPDGNLRECAYCELNPQVPLNISSPSWGKVANLNFHFIAAPPTIGSPIDTDIIIVHEDQVQEGYRMHTRWLEKQDTYGSVYMNFSVLGSCHFHYEAIPPPEVGGEATPIIMSMDNPETSTLLAWLTTITLSLVVTVVYVKKRKRNTEINS